VKRLLLLLACAALLPGCGKKASDEIDFGAVEKSVYRNEYFGFSITLPADWSIQDQESKQRIMEMGGKMIAGDDQSRKAMMKASELQTVQLLAAFRHPLGTPVPYNPSVMCVAERVSHVPGIKQGRDYLFHTRRVLESSPMKISFPKDVSAAQLGGREFDVMHVEMQVTGVTVRQKYYASIMKGYALGCIMSYQTGAEESVLDGILATTRFK
jgi:hypothetical protein